MDCYSTELMPEVRFRGSGAPHTDQSIDEIIRRRGVLETRQNRTESPLARYQANQNVSPFTSHLPNHSFHLYPARVEMTCGQILQIHLDRPRHVRHFQYFNASINNFWG